MSETDERNGRNYVTTTDAPPLPLPWLLTAVVAACWWPFGSYWQSDDFVAVTYGQDLGRAFQDFGQSQFGLTSLVQFFRPMITLSFAFDALFGDAASLVAHAGNAVIHGISAMLLARIVARFAPLSCAWATGLVWGLAPCHFGSVAWAIGRVDGHSTFWITLATLFLVQWCGGERRTRTASILCFVVALCTKELAWVMPGIAGVFCFSMATPGKRVRGLVSGIWPYFVVLAIYFVWRYVTIGKLVGGYEGAIEPGPALRGLGHRTSELVNPLMHSGSAFAQAHAFELPQAVIWLGFLPVALGALGILTRQRFAMLLAIVCLFLGCAVPSLQVWADTANPMLLRQFYLPMMPVAALLAAWGWKSAIPVLVVAAAPFLELRQDYQDSWARCAQWHEQIRDLVPRSPQELNFVAGLPRQNDRATCVEFHLWIDRLLLPPFGDGGRRLLALRPLSQQATRHLLPYGTDQELPFGSTFAGSHDALAAVASAPKVEPMGCEWTGPTHLDTKILDQMVANFQKTGSTSHETDPNVVLRGTRSKLLRVTIFTGDGYLTAFVPDTAKAGAKDGRLDIGLLLWASVDAADANKVGDLIQRATALDLSTRFPVLIEADTRKEFSGRPADFVATRANYVPVWLELPRLFANWWP